MSDYFRHPSLLARMAAAVETLSGGRSFLGVGPVGTTKRHGPLACLSNPVKERMDRPEEGLEVIMRCWGMNQRSSPAAIISSKVLIHA